MLVIDSSCGYSWCLCFRQMGQSWRMWWTVCSASLQWQRTESMMPNRFRCARRPQCPVRNLNIVVCSCLARRLIGSVEGVVVSSGSFPLTFLAISEQGFGFLVNRGRHGLWLFARRLSQAICSHFLESHGGPGSTVGPRCIHGGEAACLSAVGGLADQGYWKSVTEGLL